MKNTYLILLFVASTMLGLQSCQSNTNSKDGTTKEEPKEEQRSIENTNSDFASGLDLSIHQRYEINWLKTHHEQLSFIICKATEGDTYTDPYFKVNWETTPTLGLKRGAYHFYRTKDNPKRQAEHYLNVINLQAGDIPPILDFEKGGFEGAPPQSKEEIQDNVLIFLRTVEEKSGRKPIIYVNSNDANQYLTRAEFGEYPIWIADWEKRAEPILPDVWRGKKWTFWQKTAYDYLDDRRNDFDVFNGNAEALEAFIRSN